MQSDSSDIADARAAIVRAAEDLLADRIDLLSAIRLIGNRAHQLPDWFDDVDLLEICDACDDSERYAFADTIDEWHPDLRADKRVQADRFLVDIRPTVLASARAIVERFARPA